MTTSVSAADIAAAPEPITRPEAQSTPPAFHFRHTLPSRFAFLILSVAIVLSALAYGTVHYWALAIFNLGAVAILVLWVLDAWQLGVVRISRNALQLPLVGILAVAAVQLLPLRSGDAGAGLTRPGVRSLSFDAYSTRLFIVQVAALLVYFAATLVFTDTPHRLRLLVRTITIFGFLLALFGLTQSFTSSNKVYWVRELAQSTAFGPFINRHHFAGYMELTIALPLGLIFAGAVEKEKRFIYLFAAALMGVALIMTNSRGGIISLVAELLFLAAIAGFRRRHQSHTEEKSRARGAAVRAALAL